VTARLVLDCKNIVGESIIWSDTEQCLYWVDIVGSRIHSLMPATGNHQAWPTPELPTSIGLAKDGGFIVGLRQRITRWRPGGQFETFAVPEPDRPANRLNEGVVAPDGSFWVGTMQDNIGPDLGPREMTEHIGALYRVSPDGRVAELSGDRFGITNTMVWLDDGRFVTADTLRNELYCYDYDRKSQRLVNRRTFAEVTRGLPDGSARDAAGNIYNARVAGGAALVRIDPTDGAAKLLELPCKSPTSCAFGGEGLTTLYITSSRFGLTAEALQSSSVDGSLHAVDDLGPGLKPYEFG
jgi:sugar lactone lactonase YvrE